MYACRINASHDLDAIHSWLSSKDGNGKTHSAYKKELERLLLWAVLERGKALSSLNTDDCTAYVHFLTALTTADRQWVTLAPAIKGQGSWKPFTFRRPKTRAGAQASDVPDPPARVLSPRSVNYAKTVISSCLDWLVKQQYLQHNNFDGLPSIKYAQAKGQANNRAFTLKQMQRVFAYAEAQVAPGALDYPATRRTLYLLKLAFATGLRIHELAAASFGDIECLEDDRGEHYFLRVVGKNSKERKTSLPQLFIEELKAYLKVRGLPAQFGFLPQQAPLVPSLRDKSGRKHLSTAGIHKVLAAFFGQMASDLEGTATSAPAWPTSCARPRPIGCATVTAVTWPMTGKCRWPISGTSSATPTSAPPPCTLTPTPSSGNRWSAMRLRGCSWGANVRGRGRRCLRQDPG